MLDELKILLNTDNDNLINVLIQQAISEAVAYTHNEDTSILSPAIIQMVIYKYNRIGTEGLNSEGYSGVSFNYINDYPENIKRILNTHRKIRVI